VAANKHRWFVTIIKMIDDRIALIPRTVAGLREAGIKRPRIITKTIDEIGALLEAIKETLHDTLPQQKAWVIDQIKRINGDLLEIMTIIKIITKK